MPTQALKLAGVSQKFYQFLHVFFGFFNPCNISKSGFNLVFAH